MLLRTRLGYRRSPDRLVSWVLTVKEKCGLLAAATMGAVALITGVDARSFVCLHSTYSWQRLTYICNTRKRVLSSRTSFRFDMCILIIVPNATAFVAAFTYFFPLWFKTIFQTCHSKTVYLVGQEQRSSWHCNASTVLSLLVDWILTNYFLHLVCMEKFTILPLLSYFYNSNVTLLRTERKQICVL